MHAQSTPLTRHTRLESRLAPVRLSAARGVHARHVLAAAAPGQGTALITGSSSGIGRGVALELAEKVKSGSKFPFSGDCCLLSALLKGLVAVVAANPAKSSMPVTAPGT